MRQGDTRAKGFFRYMRRGEVGSVRGGWVYTTVCPTCDKWLQHCWFNRVFSHKFGVVQARRTPSNLLKKHAIRESEVYRVFSHKFGVVQAHRTSSNLLKKHAIRESEVYRVFHISSGWFKHIEPHRTSSK